MGGLSSRRKGKSGEAEVAALLDTLFYPHDTTAQVIRTPMSGAWSELGCMSGDVLFIKDGKPDTRVPYYIEVKRREPKAVSPYNILLGDVGVLADWLTHAIQKQGRPMSTIPLVFWRVDYQPWFIFMREEDFGVQQAWFGPLPETKSVLIVGTAHKGYFVNIPWRLFQTWAGAPLDNDILVRAEKAGRV